MRQISTIITLLIVLYSCKNKQGSVNTLEEIQEESAGIDLEHNSRNSLDWAGDYTGIVACADCRGIETKLTLKDDQTYAKRTKYLGKGNKTFTSYGSFQWLEDGSIIELKSEKSEKSIYRVEENGLRMLDKSGRDIETDNNYAYFLNKNESPAVNKYWKATEIMGVSVASKELNIEPHLILRSNNTFSATGGCNSIFGQFTLKDKNSISFGESPAITEMACGFENFDDALLEALSMSQQFMMQGEDQLQLLVGKRAALAKFEAVYLY